MRPRLRQAGIDGAPGRKDRNTARLLRAFIRDPDGKSHRGSDVSQDDWGGG